MGTSSFGKTLLYYINTSTGINWTAFEKKGGIFLIFIILALPGDDEKLLMAFFDDIGSAMYCVAYKVLENSDDAEEAVQEAFLRMMKNIERIKSLPCPKRAPYCVVIVKNISKNMRRSQREYSDIDEYADFLSADTYTDPEDDYFARVDSERLEQAVLALEKHDRDIVLLRWGKKMRFREIGIVLGISKEAAAKRGQRALKKLRESYFEGTANG